MSKVTYFTRTLPKAERDKIINSLPKREDYISKLNPTYANHYLPIYVQDMTRKVGRGLEYNILTTGIRANGEKIGVFVRGYRPNFMFIVPKDTTFLKMKTRIENIAEDNVWDLEISEVVGRNYKYYAPPQSMIRLTFKSLISRKKMKTLLANFTYENITGFESTCVPEFLNDDMHHMFRAVSRERKLKYCLWWKISKFNEVYDFKFKGYEAHIDDITVIKEPDDVLQKDKTMTMQWDLETISYKPDGSAPSFEKILNKEGKKENLIFMNTMSFSWYLEKKPFVTINTTFMPVPKVENCILVQTKDDEDIMILMAIIMERMSPDIVNGFNASGYDWPFVMNTIEVLDERNKLKNLKKLIPFLGSNENDLLMLKKTMEHVMTDTKKARAYAKRTSFITDANFSEYEKKIRQISESADLQLLFKKRLSSLKPTPELLKYTIRGRNKCEIKLEGAMSMEFIYFDAPGYIVIDTRIIFRKIYTRAEESNLNFFLKCEKLKPKLDMPYNRMFKIFIYLKTLSKMYGIKNYYEIIQKYTEEDTPLKTYRFNQEYFNPKSLFYISDTKEQILELLVDAKLIVEYCNQDGYACHDLTLKRNIIKDCRAWATLSFVSFADTIFYADGMRVRNIIIANGFRDKFKIYYPIAKTTVKSNKKYPGAYVVYPKRGMYRAHRFDKRRRRQSFKNSEMPNKEELIKSDDFNELFPLNEDEIDDNDFNDLNDRPITPIDFSSLYPNLIITYNLSPEMVLHPSVDEKTIDKKVLTTTFKYDDPKLKEEEKQSVTARVVQYTTPTLEGGIGVYAHILKKLYLYRCSIKKLMGPYEAAKILLAKAVCKTTDQLIEILNKLLEEARITSLSGKKFHIREYENMKKTIAFVTYLLGQNDEFQSDGTFELLYDHVMFKYNYYNAYQLSVKIAMNTFYGDTGNSASPFFTIEVAGSITSNGVASLCAIKKYSEDEGYNVIYGDTDSLYMMIPERYFKEVDAKYENGLTSKLAYWEEMIDITQEVIDVFSGEVNDYLYSLNGTRFLKVEVEGVCTSCVFAKKKRYIMLKHLGISNLDICKPGKTVEDVLACRNLDVKGFEYKKRGASKFLKNEFAELLRDIMSFDNTDTLFELVDRQFKNIKKRQYDLQYFVKSARYIPAKLGRPGNVAVLSFINRMKEIRVNHPDADLPVVIPGDRFKYVISKKYPFRYDFRGCKKDISAGEKYEFIENYSNEKYQALLDEPLTVDLDYYIEHEIIAQMTCLIMYHKRFRVICDDPKIEDKKIHALAENYIMDIYDKMKDKVIDIGPAKKLEYKAFSKILEKDQPRIIKDMSNILLSAEVQDQKLKKNTVQEICETLFKKEEANAKKIDKVDIYTLISRHRKYNEKFDITDMHSLYIHKNGFAAQKKRILTNKINIAKKSIQKLIEDYQFVLIGFKTYAENKKEADKSGNEIGAFDYDESLIGQITDKCMLLRQYMRAKNELDWIITKVEEEYNFRQTKKIVATSNREDVFMNGVLNSLEDKLSSWGR